jgi:hypothetical protein
MQSVIPPGDPSRTVIAGQRQGWRGLAINFGTASFEDMVRNIAAFIVNAVHYGQTEDTGHPGIIFPTMTTAWEPSPDELARLNAGGKVIVRQLGSPPINPMSVDVGECPVDNAV